jgi:hypothetical protein
MTGAAPAKSNKSRLAVRDRGKDRCINCCQSHRTFCEVEAACQATIFCKYITRSRMLAARNKM